MNRKCGISSQTWIVLFFLFCDWTTVLPNFFGESERLKVLFSAQVSAEVLTDDSAICEGDYPFQNVKYYYPTDGDGTPVKISFARRNYIAGVPLKVNINAESINNTIKSFVLQSHDLQTNLSVGSFNSLYSDDDTKLAACGGESEGPNTATSGPHFRERSTVTLYWDPPPGLTDVVVFRLNVKTSSNPTDWITGITSGEIIPKSKECYNSSISYTGSVAESTSGTSCLRWDSLLVRNSNDSASRNSTFLGDFCRGTPPSCFVLSGDVKLENCDIPKCSDIRPHFMEFGESVGDQKLPMTGQEAGRINFTTVLSMAGVTYNTASIFEDGLFVLDSDFATTKSLRLSSHGIFSLVDKDEHANPNRTAVIAPFWTNVRRGDTGTGRGYVYYRQSSDLDLLVPLGDTIKENTKTYQPEDEEIFMPTWALVVTWHLVGDITSSGAINELSTFQAAVATDGNRTFIIYNYEMRGWIDEEHTALTGYCRALGYPFVSRTSQQTTTDNFWSASRLGLSLTQHTNVERPGQRMYEVVLETIPDELSQHLAPAVVIKRLDAEPTPEVRTRPKSRGDRDPCYDIDCGTSGTCDPDNSACVCDPGYSGGSCQIDVDECGSSPCQNGGSCVDGIGRYVCDCRPGFTGTRCEQNINDCLGKPCLNGGTCEDAENDFKCTCKPAYTGKRCEKLIDQCSSEPCYNGGTCLETDDGYLCNCIDGFTGQDCQLRHCFDGSTCERFQTCYFITGAPNCTCSDTPVTTGSCITVISPPEREPLIRNEHEPDFHSRRVYNIVAGRAQVKNKYVNSREEVVFFNAHGAYPTTNVSKRIRQSTAVGHRIKEDRNAKAIQTFQPPDRIDTIRIRRKRNAERCEAISQDTRCHDVLSMYDSYTQVALPHRGFDGTNYDSQQSANGTINFFHSVPCDPMFPFFVCASILPSCIINTVQALLPSRSFCTAMQASCTLSVWNIGSGRTVFTKYFPCSQYPESGVERPAPRTTTEQSTTVLAVQTTADLRDTTTKVSSVELTSEITPQSDGNVSETTTVARTATPVSTATTMQGEISTVSSNSDYTRLSNFTTGDIIDTSMKVSLSEVVSAITSQTAGNFLEITTVVSTAAAIRHDISTRSSNRDSTNLSDFTTAVIDAFEDSTPLPAVADTSYSITPHTTDEIVLSSGLATDDLPAAISTSSDSLLSNPTFNSATTESLATAQLMSELPTYYGSSLDESTTKAGLSEITTLAGIDTTFSEIPDNIMGENITSVSLSNAETKRNYTNTDFTFDSTDFEPKGSVTSTSAGSTAAWSSLSNNTSNIDVTDTLTSAQLADGVVTVTTSSLLENTSPLDEPTTKAEISGTDTISDIDTTSYVTTKNGPAENMTPALIVTAETRLNATGTDAIFGTTAIESGDSALATASTTFVNGVEIRTGASTDATTTVITVSKGPTRWHGTEILETTISPAENHATAVKDGSNTTLDIADSNRNDVSSEATARVLVTSQPSDTVFETTDDVEPAEIASTTLSSRSTFSQDSTAVVPSDIATFEKTTSRDSTGPAENINFLGATTELQNGAFSTAAIAGYLAATEDRTSVFWNGTEDTKSDQNETSSTTLNASTSEPRTTSLNADVGTGSSSQADEGRITEFNSSNYIIETSPQTQFDQSTAKDFEDILAFETATELTTQPHQTGGLYRVTSAPTAHESSSESTISEAITTEKLFYTEEYDTSASGSESSLSNAEGAITSAAPIMTNTSFNLLSVTGYPALEATQGDWTTEEDVLVTAAHNTALIQTTTVDSKTESIVTNTFTDSTLSSSSVSAQSNQTEILSTEVASTTATLNITTEEMTLDLSSDSETQTGTPELTSGHPTDSETGYNTIAIYETPPNTERPARSTWTSTFGSPNTTGSTTEGDYLAQFLTTYTNQSDRTPTVQPRTIALNNTISLEPVSNPETSPLQRSTQLYQLIEAVAIPTVQPKTAALNTTVSVEPISSPETSAPSESFTQLDRPEETASTPTVQPRTVDINRTISVELVGNPNASATSERLKQIDRTVEATEPVSIPTVQSTTVTLNRSISIEPVSNLNTSAPLESFKQLDQTVKATETISIPTVQSTTITINRSISIEPVSSRNTSAPLESFRQLDRTVGAPEAISISTVQSTMMALNRTISLETVSDLYTSAPLGSLTQLEQIEVTSTPSDIDTAKVQSTRTPPIELFVSSTLSTEPNISLASTSGKMSRVNNSYSSSTYETTSTNPFHDSSILSASAAATIGTTEISTHAELNSTILTSWQWSTIRPTKETLETTTPSKIPSETSSTSHIIIGLASSDNEVCRRSLTIDDEIGDILWRETQAGEIAISPCPSPSNKNATRECDRSIWLEPNTVDCDRLAASSVQLLTLTRGSVTAENASEVANQILNITGNNVAQLMSYDIANIAGLLSDVVEATGNVLDLSISRNIFGAISNIIDVPSEQLRSASRDFSTNSRFLRIIDDVLLKIEIKGDAEYLESRNIKAAVSKINSSENLSGISFALSSDKDSVKFKRTQDSDDALLILPRSLLSSVPARSDRVQFAVHTKLALFENTEMTTQVEDTEMAANYTLVSQYVVSASVGDRKISNLTDRVTIVLPRTSINYNGKEPLCVFYQFPVNGASDSWSQDGCHLKEATESSIVCECDHLTNFAAIMDVYGTVEYFDEYQQGILQILTYIGCGLSIFGLLSTLISYTIFKKIRKEAPAKILICLCTALIAVNVVYLFMHSAYYSSATACVAVAATMHYVLLSSLTWMGIEAINMYIALVRVFNTYYRRYMLKMSIVGWGFPGLVVASAFVVQVLTEVPSYQMNSKTEICWLRREVFYGALVAPFGVIFIFNIVVYCLVLGQLLGMSSRKLKHLDSARRMRRPAKRENVRKIRGAIGLMALLGITWGFALGTIDEAALTFSYVFVVFNSSQGFWVFLFHCVFKKEVSKSWRRLFCRKGRKFSDGSSRWSRFSSNSRATKSTRSMSSSSIRTSYLVPKPSVSIDRSEASIGMDSNGVDRVTRSNSDGFINPVFDEKIDPGLPPPFPPPPIPTGDRAVRLVPRRTDHGPLNVASTQTERRFMEEEEVDSENDSSEERRDSFDDVFALRGGILRHHRQVQLSPSNESGVYSDGSVSSVAPAFFPRPQAVGRQSEDVTTDQARSNEAGASLSSDVFAQTKDCRSTRNYSNTARETQESPKPPRQILTQHSCTSLISTNSQDSGDSTPSSSSDAKSSSRFWKAPLVIKRNENGQSSPDPPLKISKEGKAKRAAWKKRREASNNAKHDPKPSP